MDLTRPVEYRNLQLNALGFNEPPEFEGDHLTGIQLESADYSEVPGVGYVEKRAAGDGYDATDITLGMRNVQLSGTVFGRTRGILFDQLARLRLAFSPTSAFADAPGDYGYIPLNFEVPTGLTDADQWPGGFIAQCVRVRPVAGLSFPTRRDAIGGDAERGFSMPWQARLQARDPRVYAQVSTVDSSMAGGTTGSHSGHLRNRGNYPAPINIVLILKKSAAALTYTVQIGGSTLQLTIPTNANWDQILRYDGTHKVVTLQIDQTASLRMDLMKMTAGVTHPQVPAGGTDFTWTRAGGAIEAGSQLWYWEAWA